MGTFLHIDSFSNNINSFNLATPPALVQPAVVVSPQIFRMEFLSTSHTSQSNSTSFNLVDSTNNEEIINKYKELFELLITLFQKCNDGLDEMSDTISKPSFLDGDDLITCMNMPFENYVEALWNRKKIEFTHSMNVTEAIDVFIRELIFESGLALFRKEYEIDHPDDNWKAQLLEDITAENLEQRYNLEDLDLLYSSLSISVEDISRNMIFDKDISNS